MNSRTGPVAGSQHPQGAGWWVASDGLFYPPEQHPSVRHQPPPPRQQSKNGISTKAKVIIGVVGFIALSATIANIGADDEAVSETVAAVGPTGIAQTETEASRAPQATVEVAPIPDNAVMPDLICTGLQDAQDELQELTGVFFASNSIDASGEGRQQIIDRNWIVTDQDPPAGSAITDPPDLYVLKASEVSTCGQNDAAAPEPGVDVEPAVDVEPEAADESELGCSALDPRVAEMLITNGDTGVRKIEGEITATAWLPTAGPLDRFGSDTVFYSVVLKLGDTDLVFGFIGDETNTPDTSLGLWQAANVAAEVSDFPPISTIRPTQALGPEFTLAAVACLGNVTLAALPTAEPAPDPTPAAEPGLTVSQRNAVRSAESYLDFTNFSRLGLIEQLSSEYGEGFPVEDAIFAVDSLNVDWNAEAVGSAQAYLEFSAFSCQGLIDQLSSEYGEEFTQAQAEYAASQVGLC